MRFHRFKACISLVLCLILLLGTSSLAVSAAQQEVTPVIIVPGISNTPLLLDMGTPEETSVWPPELDLDSLLGPLLPALLDFLGTKDGNALLDAALPVLEDMLGAVACNADGSSKNNIGIEKVYEPLSEVKTGMGEDFLAEAIAEEIGEENVYTFFYDWRLDTMALANELRDFVEMVKTKTGASKVTLVGASLGTTIATAYLSEYGTLGDLENCVLLSGALWGVTSIGEVFTKQMEIDETELRRFFAELQNPTLDGIVDMLLGIPDIFDLLNDLIEEIIDRVFDEFLIDTFATMPGLWATVPMAYYDQAKAMLLDPAEHAQLIEVLDDYHYNVQNKTEEIFAAAEQAGVHVTLVSHYNRQGYPLSKTKNIQTDNLIDTKYTSAGATCSDLGSTLPAGYVQQNAACTAAGHNHISPDRMVDASTCVLPEQTWFVKGLDHMAYHADEEAMSLAVWLVTSSENVTVHTDAQYPQFLPKTGAAQDQPGTKDVSQTPSENDTPLPATGDPSLLVWMLPCALCAALAFCVPARRKKTIGS